MENGDDGAVECPAATVATNASAKARRCWYAASHAALKMVSEPTVKVFPALGVRIPGVRIPLSMSTGDVGERCLGINRLAVR